MSRIIVAAAIFVALAAAPSASLAQPRYALDQQGGDDQSRADPNGGQGGYQQYGPPPCAEEDDLESLQCHHRTHSRGAYHRSEREAYLRGDHYRGYQDDGTGRRSYDRGGYGVGHFDYTRDYDPQRGY